ncbi:MAG: peptidase M28 [Bacteroidetes bacterium MedPE-SWsnd-G2]|nr:MAG: peptidase M28 [Bacteroidetes bacterium MedPE-SWsnd-G2]
MKFILALIFLTGLLSCQQNQKPENKLKEDVTYLASDDLQGRETGTKGEALAANYIAERFEDLGIAPKGTSNYFQAFNFKPKTDPHAEVEYTVVNEDGSITGTNVIGFIDNKAEHTIVIGAHYDHLGYGSEGSLHRGETEIHNGADDNASGVAVMLNLASKLKGQNTNNNYMFIAFSGEEMGLLGSNYFTKNPTVPQEKINYMINMDMVGRLKPDSTLAVYGVGTTPFWKHTLSASNTKFKLVEKESGVGPSDHTSFYNIEVPVLHFFTGQHEDYHKPADDFEKLNYQGMADISDFIFSIVSELNDNRKLAFRKTKNESEDTPRFRVGLGVIPDYLYDGEGMRIDGISEEKPAQKAGLEKGDIVIQLGDSAVVDMTSYMKALSVFDKGDSTQVTVKRGDKNVNATIKF